VTIPPTGPSTVLPPIGSGSISGGSSTDVTQVPGSPSSTTGNKGKFPQTGSVSGLLITIAGLLVLLFLILKHLIKKSKNN